MRKIFSYKKEQKQKDDMCEGESERERGQRDKQRDRGQEMDDTRPITKGCDAHLYPRRTWRPRNCRSVQ